MRKLKSTLPNMILSLGLITVLAGGLLGMMYSITKDPIEITAREQQAEAISTVLPPHDNDPEADCKEIAIDGRNFTVYPAMENSKLVGVAVKGITMEGFAGEVSIICGFDSDGRVIDYRVLSQAETPGLGTKMETWFRDPSGARSILNKSPGQIDFRPVKDGGRIDGITAATISSRAFLGLVRDAYMVYMEYAGKEDVKAIKEVQGIAGASRQCHKSDE